MAPKRKHEEEHVNHERWMVSFADLTTLLFAFFVVMYAISKEDENFATEVAESVRWAMHIRGTGQTRQPGVFDGQPDLEHDLGIDAGGARYIADTEIDPMLRAVTVAERIEKKVFPLLDKIKKPQLVTVYMEGDRLLIRMQVSGFFAPGSNIILPQAIPILDAVITEIKYLGLLIRVEAHTDSTPAQGTAFRDNWHLSAARAASVASYMKNAHQIPGNYLSATGYADFRPVESNETQEGRLANRRIELVLDYSSIEQAE